MKRTIFYTTSVVVVLSLLFTSCKPSRVWTTKKKEKNERNEPVVYNRPPAPQQSQAPPPRYYNATPLIITPRAGFVMKQDREGKFFHRTPNGLLYWKGYDNRFFLDSYYLKQIRYNNYEYDEWRRYMRSSR